MAAALLSRGTDEVRRAKTSEVSGDAIARVAQSVSSVVRGKDRAVQLAMTTLLARGHLLIEDLPGVGKTTLARALAASLGGSFRRIQFTSDLLPSDIVGVSMYRGEELGFEFQPGPIFANVVLADEINRTTPRTQSALLEAMSEGSVSVDNQTHALPLPFMVLATQNPTEHFGTYPLPESQMDRFLLRIEIGYPSKEVERQLLRERRGGDPVAGLEPAIDHNTLLELQSAVEEVQVEDSLLDYAMAVVEATRNSAALDFGLSTRGSLAWFRAAQAHALVCGRSYCVPDDFKDLAVPALAHRVGLSSHNESVGQARQEAETAIAELVARIPVPA